MMNKQSLVVGLLLERLADSKVGILVKGINGIQPDEIAAELSSQRKTHIYMAAVGYGISTDMIYRNGDIIERAQGYLIEIEELDKIVDDVIHGRI